MKSVRPLLLTLGALAGLLGLALGLALTPAVQGWALRRALAARPDVALTFDAVSAGPARAELQGVAYSRGGLRVTVGRLEADYSPWALLFGGGPLQLSRVVATDLEIDASRLASGKAGAGAAGAPAAAPGAVTQVELPFGLVLDRLDLRGRALLPGPAGGAAHVATFTVEGGGIAPGAEGVVRWQVRLDDSAPDARVTSLRGDGELRLRQTAQRSFDRAQLHVVVDAAGPAIAQQSQLKLAATLETVGGAADYTLTLDTVQGGATDRLLGLHARQPDAAAPFAGEWSLQARSAQVEPFFLGGALPRFQVGGEGRFTLQPATGAVAVSGAWRGDVAALESLDPALRPLGALRFAAEFDVADAAGVTRVERLRLQLDGAQPVLALETQRSIAVDRRARQLQLGGPATGEVGRLTLHRLPLAWVRPFVREIDVSGGGVSGDFALTNGNDELRLRSVAPLRVDALTLVRDGRLLVERAEISVQVHAAVAPGLARLELADLTFRAATGDRVAGSIAVQAPLQGDAPLAVRGSLVADLPTLPGLFAGVGHLKLAGELDAAVAGERVELRAFRAELADGAGRRLVEAAGVEPFTVDLAQTAVVPTGPGERTLARVTTGGLRLEELPLPALHSWLRGAVAPAEFLVAAQGGRLFLRAPAPVRVSGLALRADGRALVEGLAFAVAPTAEFGGWHDWNFSAPDIAVQGGGGAVLGTVGALASASAAEGLRASATFQADLAALASQPVFAAWRALAAGRASGEIRAARTAAGLLAEARATLNGLVTREPAEALPVANLSARALLAPGGRLTLEAPLLLDRAGRRSDLRLAAEANRREGGFAFDATLTGQNVELLDVLGLAALLPGGSEPAPAATPATPATAPAAVQPDAAPFWQGFSGQVALDLQALARGDAWKVTGLTGLAVVDAGQVELRKFEGAINARGRVTADGRLRFEGGERPYALEGSFSLGEFDLGALLKALEPERPPTLEGVFSVAGRFQGRGATWERTLERTHGQFQLTSRQGVFRGLRRTSEKVSVATRAVELGAALGSLFGSSKVKEAAEKVAGQTYQIDQLAQTLGELPFDQFVIKLERNERLDIRLDEVSLLSPEVRLTGRGTIRHEEGQPIARQPLSLALTLAARGKVEQQLGRLRVLDGTKDDLGYAKMRETGPIGGSLLRPDPTLFFLRLLEGRGNGDAGSGN